jgi:hypothetical protein
VPKALAGRAREEVAHWLIAGKVGHYILWTVLLLFLHQPGWGLVEDVQLLRDERLPSRALCEIPASVSHRRRRHSSYKPG